MDICLAQLCRILSDARGQKLDKKVVIASATLDKSVLQPFRAGGLTVFESVVPVPSPFSTTVNKERINEHPVDVVIEVCKHKRYDQQVLCFLAGKKDVIDCAAAFEVMEFLSPLPFLLFWGEFSFLFFSSSFSFFLFFFLVCLFVYFICAKTGRNIKQGVPALCRAGHEGKTKFNVVREKPQAFLFGTHCSLFFFGFCSCNNNSFKRAVFSSALPLQKRR